MPMLRWIAVALSGLLVLAIAETSASAQKPGGTLVQITQPEPPNLAPYISTSAPIGQVTAKVYEGLLEYGFDLKPKPSLAESWEVAPDGKTVTFKLRKDVNFHDGKPFTSADVQFTIMEVLKKVHPRGISTFRDVTAVETPDDYTAIFKLNNAAPYMLAALSGYESPMLPKHIFSQGDIKTHPNANSPIGTGPFKFVEWRRGELVRLDKNPNYWRKGLPYLDRVVVRFINDETTRTAALEKGEAHVAGFVLQDAAAYLAQNRVLRRFGEHAKQRHGKGLGDELQADRLQVPRRGAEQGVEDFPDIAGERVGLAIEPQRHIAVQHLIVPRLVDDLRRLKQFGVLPHHVLDQLAAHQHGAVLAGHQGRDAPPADAAVELDPLRLGQPVPEFRPVNVDQIVGDQTAIALERLLPVDIRRGVPLIDLGLLIEAPHVRLFAVVDMVEIGDVANVDVVPALHAVPPEPVECKIMHLPAVATAGAMVLLHHAFLALENQASTISDLVLSMKARTSARSAAGTSKEASVVLRWPRKACQSASLMRIPLWDNFMSRPG